MPDRLANMGKFRRTPGWLPRGPWDWGTDDNDRPYFNRSNPRVFLDNLGYGHIHQEAQYHSNAEAEAEWKGRRDKVRKRWHDLKERVLIYFDHVRDVIEGHPENPGGISNQRMEELLDGAWEDMKTAVGDMKGVGMMPRRSRYRMQPDPSKPV